MRFDCLKDWLDWQSGLHVRVVDLGLERVAAVAHQLGLPRPARQVVTVAGTNGKGSSIALLESILLAAGQRVAVYTSPHLLHYTERVRVNGHSVSEATFCQAFARVDAARVDAARVDVARVDASRAETSLTYFEFGTLAAIDIIARAEVDVALLEVGLGGRLDAVNIISADVALITALDIDHTDWLGSDREAIAVEKAGIMRPGGVAVCSDRNPPRAIARVARQLGCRLYQLGQDFSIDRTDGYWSWDRAGGGFSTLPLPALRGDHQLNNAAGVLMVLSVLNPGGGSRQAIVDGLQHCRLPGRLQCLDHQGIPVWLDVAHNPHAAQALANVLANVLRGRQGAGRTLAVLAMLDDKDLCAFVEHLSGHVQQWFAAGLAVTRGLSMQQLQDRLSHCRSTGRFSYHPDVAQAYRHACADARPGDRILVLGSFYTVAEVLVIEQEQKYSDQSGTMHDHE